MRTRLSGPSPRLPSTTSPAPSSSASPTISASGRPILTCAPETLPPTSLIFCTCSFSLGFASSSARSRIIFQNSGSGIAKRGSMYSSGMGPTCTTCNSEPSFSDSVIVMPAARLDSRDPSVASKTTLSENVLNSSSSKVFVHPLTVGIFRGLASFSTGQDAQRPDFDHLLEAARLFRPYPALVPAGGQERQPLWALRKDLCTLGDPEPRYILGELVIPLDGLPCLADVLPDEALVRIPHVLRSFSRAWEPTTGSSMGWIGSPSPRPSAIIHHT